MYFLPFFSPGYWNHLNCHLAAALPGGIFSWMPVTAEGSLQDDTESYAEEAFEARDFLGGKWSYCIGNGHIGAEGYLHWVFYWRVFFLGGGKSFVCQLKINYRQLV